MNRALRDGRNLWEQLREKKGRQSPPTWRLRVIGSTWVRGGQNLRMANQTENTMGTGIFVGMKGLITMLNYIWYL